MTEARDLFDANRIPQEMRGLLEVHYAWDVLQKLDDFLEQLKTRSTADGTRHHVHPTAILEGNVYLDPTAQIGPHAWIQGPAWIGPGASVGHGAMLRGGVILMNDVTVGHASEIKHSLLLPGTTAAHFNYVGDAVIGAGVNLGAGVKVANLKNDGQPIRVEGRETGLRKFGAAVGDGVHVGCNAVLGPGAIIGARSSVYAGAVVRGVIPADHIVKHRAMSDVVRVQPRTQGDD